MDFSCVCPSRRVWSVQGDRVAGDRLERYTSDVDRAHSPNAPPTANVVFANWLARRDLPFHTLLSLRPDCAHELRELHVSWERLEPVLRLAEIDVAATATITERLKSTYGAGIDPQISLVSTPGDTPLGSPTDALLERLGTTTPQVSRYHLEGQIARGGMGAIVRVWDSVLRRHLAMKLILGQTANSIDSTPHVARETLARFLEEAQVTSQLDHPGIVPVHELGIDNAGRVYFTMKLVRGRDLKAVFDLVFESKEGWNETRALGVIQKACEAMAYAHAKGVIHRDLKPANVMVGDFGEVYVMDWGVARVYGRADVHDLRVKPAFSSGLDPVRTEHRGERDRRKESTIATEDGQAIGTPAYMPPEQALGQLDKLSPRSDVYAMGAMLYHLLARRIPYVAPGERVSAMGLIDRVVSGSPTAMHLLRPEVPVELVAICDKAMARDPADRYADTLALAEDLRAYLERRVVRAYETGTWAETKKWVLRNKPLAGSLAAAILILVAGVLTGLSLASNANDARTETAKKNTALIAANETISKANSDLGVAEQAAQAKAREARSSLYVTAIVGAQSSLRLNEPMTARRLLSSAPEEYRNWEWRYLDGVLNASLVTLKGGRAAAYSQDGSRIATATRDNIVLVFDAATGAEVAHMQGHTDRISTVSFDPTAARVVSASNDGTARVWDATKGSELTRLNGHTGRVTSACFSLSGTKILTASSASVTSGSTNSNPADNTTRVWDAATGKQISQTQGRMAADVPSVFSPDGSRIVTAFWNAFARIWDPETGTELARLKGHTLPLTSVAYSPDGTRIVTASYDKTARVWNAQTGKEVARLEGHLEQLNSAVFSPDGTRIVTSAWDNTARVWNAETGKELARLKGHTNWLRFAAFSSDGKCILTCSDDATARTWNAATGEEYAQLRGHLRPVTFAAFSPDGSRVLTSSWDNTARIWDGRSHDAMTGHTSWVMSACFSPDGTRVLTAADKSIRLWDATLSTEIAQVETKSPMSRAAFSPDGSRIVSADQGHVVRLWEGANVRAVRSFDGHTDLIESITFSPDGSQVVTGSRDNSARVWSVGSGACTVLTGHTGWVVACSFDRMGARVVTASWDHSARLWDSSTWKEIGLLEGHTGALTAVSFDPEGTRVLTASWDHTARIWDAESAKEVVRLEGHLEGVGQARFSKDGSRVVTAGSDATARVWDARTGMELLRLSGHTQAVNDACFSPDNTRILTASEDHTARLWDALTGRELLRLEGHTDRVLGAMFDGSGSRIVTCAADNTARVWDSASHAERILQR